MSGGYGAVDTNEPNDTESQPFQESDVYYLKEQKMSREDRVMKILLAAVPLLVAVLIMGGIGFLLFKDFDHLYPGPGGSTSPSNLKPRGPPIISPQGTAPDYSPAIDDQPTAPTPSYLKPRGPPISSPTAPAPAPKTSPSSSSSISSSGCGECSANPACNEIGLTGKCCPTGEGVMLGCCS
jgi:hypothetical protein